MSSKKISDVLQIGFALFALFFGAGNLIFPPYLGWQSGENWFAGFLCFLFVDIGMGLFIIYAVAKIGEGSEGIVKPLGKRCSFLFLAAICLSIGPCIAIPRTASLTYEIGIVPAFGEINSWLFTLAFFVLVFIASIKKSRLISLVGSVMSPLMFIALLIMIAVSIIHPIGEIAPNIYIDTVIKDSLMAGYQTMDMLAAVIFAIAMINAIKDKGYNSASKQGVILICGGLFATGLLFLVYGGLAYIGATASVINTEEMSQSRLLISLVYMLMGPYGLNLLSIIVTFACMTTAIGLLTSIGEYFEEKLNIRYEIIVAVFTVISWLLSNLGTSSIITLAVPILNMLYPVLIILTVFAFVQNIVYHYLPCQMSALVAVLVSIILEIEKVLGVNVIENYLPLTNLGFAWVIPALIAFTAGYAYCLIKK